MMTRRTALNKFPEIEGHDFIMEEMLKKVTEMQEEVLRGILRQILGREPELEDAKLLTIIRYPGDILDYSIAYLGTEVGRVEFETEGAKWTVTFKPGEKSING